MTVMIPVVMLTALLLGGCSWFGVYDRDGYCRFAPMGPPAQDAGAPLVIYSNSGAGAGTVVPTPTGATLYNVHGSRVGTVR